MFFVFNPIALIICIQVSIVFGLTLRRDWLDFERDTQGIVSFAMKMLVLVVIGVLGWVQISVLMAIMFNENEQNTGSWIIMCAFPVWTMLLTWAMTRLRHFR